MIKLILWKRIMFFRWICIAIITILFNLYSNTTSLILSIFNCKQIEEDILLVRDLKMECWTGSHAWWAFFYGVPMIIFFVFGIPLLGVLILFFSRKHLGSDYSRVVVLHQGLKHHVYYWEFVNIFRKVLLLCIWILLPFENQFYKAALSLILIIFCLRIQIRLSPYKIKAFTEIEQREMISSCITIYFGLLFVTEETSISLQILSLAIILVFNIWFIFGWIYCVYETVITKRFHNYKLAKFL